MIRLLLWLTRQRRAGVPRETSREERTLAQNGTKQPQMRLELNLRPQRKAGLGM